MKSQELRIGNWVKDVDDHSEFYQVREIMEDGFSAGPMTVYPAGMEFDYGIKLTQEWLNKLGFEVSDRLDNAWTDKNVGFPIWWNDEANSAYHINSETLVHLDYVHQLQNVFFALTGQELTITK